MKHPPIGLGMYTLFQSARKDFEGAVAQAAQMGYEGLEMYGEPEEFPPARVSKALKCANLPLVGWHMEWKHLQPQELARTIDLCKEADLRTLIIPCLGGKWAVAHTPAQECEAIWDGYLKRIEEIRARLAQEGIRLGYHNHEHEFQLRYGGRTLFEKLYNAMNPEIVMELDSGNAIEGGANPAAMLAAYGERPAYLHCKPFSQADAFNTVIGQAGDLNDWAAMVKAGEKRLEWLIVESESARLSEPDNARACLRGLRNALGEA